MRLNGIALQAAALAVVLLSAGAARAESTPMGIWIDHTGRGAVEITDCNGKLCGYVAWVKNPKDAEGCGEQIIGDVKSVGGGKWDHGWIYDPDSASKYDVELTPLGNGKLRVLGYSGTKWLSETMTWKRAPVDLKKCTKSGNATEAKAAPAAAPAPTAAKAPAAKTEAKTETAKDTAKDAKDETAAAKPEESGASTAGATETDSADTAEKADKEPGKKVKQLAEVLKDMIEEEEETTPSGGKKKTCKIDLPYVLVKFPCD